MMRKYRYVIFLAIILISLMSLACSASRISQLFGEYPTNPGDLLFQDGFSDPSSGWDRVRTDEGITDYDEDRYRIVVNLPNADYWSNPGLDFNDVRINVDAGKYVGSDDNDFGVLCRYQDTENFYFFIISSDGYYGIGKVEGGEQKLLEPPQMYFSEVINTGVGPNHIEAVCNGARLTLLINGLLIAETSDHTFKVGDIGLIVGSFDIPGVDIWFDNLRVTVP
jgi:hypothetical protein